MAAKRAKQKTPKQQPLSILGAVMAASTPKYRALILCPMRYCPTCKDEVPVRDDLCGECGTHIPKPERPRIPRPRRELTVIPSLCWGLEQAAKTMGSLEACVLTSAN
jgi:hypothetical protein